MTVRFELRLSDELMAEVDRLRGLASRAAYVRRAVELAVQGRLMSDSAVDAVARAAVQAERTVPAPAFDPGLGKGDGVTDDTEAIRAAIPGVKRGSDVKPPSPGELKTRAAMLERQRKLNERKG